MFQSVKDPLSLGYLLNFFCFVWSFFSVGCCQEAAVTAKEAVPNPYILCPSCCIDYLQGYDLTCTVGVNPITCKLLLPPGIQIKDLFKN